MSAGIVLGDKLLKLCESWMVSVHPTVRVKPILEAYRSLLFAQPKVRMCE